MKVIYVCLVCSLLGSAVCAQGSSDYYQSRKAPDRSYDRLLMRYGSYLAERWYVGAEGFARVDNSALSSGFRGLVAGNAVTRPGWSALIGWTYRDAWAMEAGYARSPIHNELAINPYVFRFENEKNGFVLRAKRQLFSTSPQERRSGLWVSAGLWLIPNAGEVKSRLTLEGYGRRSYQREIDTLVIMTQTATNARNTGLVELGLEYTVRLSNRFDLGINARKYWGLGSSITTDLNYSVNGQAPQTATLQGRGSGASFGMSLRYTYSRKHLIAKTNIYDLRGKRPPLGQPKGLN